MKRLPMVIFIAFLLLIIGSIYLAGRHYDGLVVENYYSRAERFFRDREKEKSLGLKINLVDRIKKGNNLFRVFVTTREGGLGGAKISLMFRKVSHRDYSLSYLKEKGLGEYISLINIKETGNYLFVLTVKHPLIETQRVWTERIE